MRSYILKRVAAMVVMLFGITLFIYTIMFFMGDPATYNLDIKATPDAKAEYYRIIGYNQPYLARFALYLKGVFSGTMGISYQSQNPVWDEIAARTGMTFLLGIVSFAAASVVGIALGIVSAVRQYSILDTITNVVAVLFACIPAFFIGILLMILFCIRWNLLPSYFTGRVEDYVLPVITLVMSSFPVIMRMTRAAMLDTLSQDYIRTARAKGCMEWKVIWKHALKNASLPIITLLGTTFSGVLGGSMIVENVFSMGGLGMYLVDSIQHLDAPAVMSVTLLLSTLFMGVMLLIDILYAVIDPRLKARYQ